MVKQGIFSVLGVAALAGMAIAVVPAIGAPGRVAPRSSSVNGPVGDFGFFTPAAADPKLAALLGREVNVNNDRFRFTPVDTGKRRAVTVAVRASSVRGPVRTAGERATTPAPETGVVGIAPVAYNLGVAVGWKRFAISGDVGRVNNGALPGSREAADLGISYNTKKWSSRVQVAAERPLGNMPRSLTGGESYSVDVASSYRLTRNLDVTAGVRYKSERDRLIATPDQRRDSQAAYVGTSIRF